MVRLAPKGKREPYEQIFHNGKKRRAHEVIAEKALGKPLPKGAEVHHIDENKLNNKNSNLVICPSRSYHFLLHRRQRALAECGNANWLWCCLCQSWDNPTNLIVKPMHGNRTYIAHRACKNKKQNEARWRKKRENIS